MRIAIVTMVYNEPEYIPIWCNYYGQLFGPECCYIIDHGSDDESLSKYSNFNIVRIPRSPKDNKKRTDFISEFCNALLKWYDAFIYVDVDEIIASGDASSLPRKIASLGEGTFSAYGFDIHQEIVSEAPFKPHKLVTWQRRWVRFSSSMCKVVVSTRPIEWSSGFHTAKSPLNFADLYLFHLRYFDLSLGLKRLARTRRMQWAHANAGAHQRVDDDAFIDLMTRVARLPKVINEDLTPRGGKLREYASLVEASEKDYNTCSYNIDLHIFGAELIEIPMRFNGLF